VSLVGRAARFCGLATMIAVVALLVVSFWVLVLRGMQDVIPKLALHGQHLLSQITVRRPICASRASCRALTWFLPGTRSR
jgi:TRAP-type mannitol/chloroaromatic compound transport system permease small subunit